MVLNTTSDPSWVSAIIAGMALLSAWVWRQVVWGQRLTKIEQRQCDMQTAFENHEARETQWQRDVTARLDRLIERQGS